MGMFDTIRCNYDAGAGFHNRELQTKDLECMMFEYWITPHGQLYQIDYSGTQSIVDSGAQDFRIVTVPNGNHGKITAMDITKTYAPFPRIHFHFRDGVINWVSKPGSNRL